ncbi:unnamed protein product [Linum trigynum]|uniref:Uncharacterized protein n=1 Tax=Linum trigynum TaxID=586398 RepID=A0AAV2EUR1_9ROSI
MTTVMRTGVGDEENAGFGKIQYERRPRKAETRWRQRNEGRSRSSDNSTDIYVIGRNQGQRWLSLKKKESRIVEGGSRQGFKVKTRRKKGQPLSRNRKG